MSCRGSTARGPGEPHPRSLPRFEIRPKKETPDKRGRQGLRTDKAPDRKPRTFTVFLSFGCHVTLTPFLALEGLLKAQSR